MLDNLTDGNEVERIAQSSLAQACERARQVVAENPADENAALDLKEAIERFALAEPRERCGLPEASPAVAEARDLIAGGKLEDAEILLRQHLKVHRHDPTAMHLMAEIAASCDLREDAERILRESARIHANSPDAWVDLGMTLHRIACKKDYPEFVHRSVAALDEALARDPAHETALAYRAAVLAHTRSLEQALSTYQQLLSLNPQVSAHWLNFGYLLKTFGRFGEGVAAYRTALALDPSNGAAWWGLANLKLARFFSSDVREMESVLESPTLADQSRVEILFALAKALDQAKEYERAAQRLDQGSELRSAIQIAESNIVSGDAEFVLSVFTPTFFKKRQGWGDPRPDPIFILGMPRAGSTLVEQILSSHSAIEGTEELFVLHQFSAELAGQHGGKTPEQIVCGLTESECSVLGARYVELASRSRRTDRPFFTDKNPSNWRHVGLIHTMLPNAKIVDVRRNPMDCCFANYAQHFQAGANFSYNQRDLGRYYADYVRTMRHFDEVLPGRVQRVIHDDLVENFEDEVRRLLDYLGLPFEQACLRFYETERPVHTPSSEQVRQPINRSGFGKWRNYEPWLGDLKASLGETLENWR